jgi:DNA-binding MarR family transcriptional regulator
MRSSGASFYRDQKQHSGLSSAPSEFSSAHPRTKTCHLAVYFIVSKNTCNLQLLNVTLLHMEPLREQLQLFTRRFGLLNASCCDECCGEQVSMAQSYILFEIRRAGNPAMQRVAEELGMDITTFSRQIKSLQTKGLISKRVSPDDRRVTLLSLTDEGMRVLVQIDLYMKTRVDQIFAEMSVFERETVVRSLELLNESVVKAGKAGSWQEGTIACCK